MSVGGNRFCTHNRFCRNSYLKCLIRFKDILQVYWYSKCLYSVNFNRVQSFCVHESNENYIPHSHVAGLPRLLVPYSKFSLAWADHVALFTLDLGLVRVLARATLNYSIPGMSHSGVSYLGEDKTSFLSNHYEL